MLFAALLLSALSMSCSHDPHDENQDPSNTDVHEWEDSTLSGDAVMGSAMTFKVGGGMSVERTAQTRTTTDINGIATFTEGDLVAVAVTRSGGSEVVKLYQVKSDGSLEYAGGDNDPFVWKSTGESVTIRAWSYGTSNNLSYTLTAPETRDYTLETDQQTNDYRELLYCKAANKSYSSGAISLNFYHQLARMVFNVTHESANPLTISSVSIGGSSFPKMARFNVPTGSSNVGTWVVKSGTGSTGSITPRTETPTTTGYLATYSAVVFPTFTTQNYAQNTPIFTVTSGTNNYTYKIAESEGMAYDGNTQYNYTIKVMDGMNIRKNPLWWMAKWNVTSSCTFDKTASTSQGDHISWETAMSSAFGLSNTTSSHDSWATAGKIIEGEKYHLPIKKEYQSIVPLPNEGSTAEWMIFSTRPTANTVFTEPASVFGYDGSTQAGVAYKSYWSTYSTTGLRYAIRFLGTEFCSVWRYKYYNVGTTSSRLEISAKLIDVIAASETSKLSAKMTELLSSNDSYWAENEAAGAVQRVMYACGYNGGNRNRGHYWAATNNGGGYAWRLCWFSNNSDLNVNLYPYTDGIGFSVRPFHDE